MSKFAWYSALGLHLHPPGYAYERVFVCVCWLTALKLTVSVRVVSYAVVSK